jgi:hypothetical protein
MTQHYAQHDKRLINNENLSLQLLNPEVNDTNKLAHNGGSLFFQFPPKILTDNRKGEWSENNIPGREPVAAFKRSGAREFGLVITYIVDSISNKDGYFSPDRISQITHFLRGYYAEGRNTADQRNYVVKFKYIGYGGKDPISCYIRGIDVKHSDTIILNPDTEIRSFPLRTDITLDMRIWSSADEESLQDIAGTDTLTAAWY